MTAITELDKLLCSMSPELVSGEFVFCTVQGTAQDYLALDPIMTFIESEGLTLILPKQTAYYHDHIFVQTDKAEAALAALKEFSAQPS